ncbi:M15 family metallopeptidase [Oerskovia flava]|uniref:M15 family metallopeptidase n=1 Tax=Oerskovia flava TaxID=2986422 RepID=UPI0022406C1F|nr:D-alanyl-D-alanine carboxypeptidase family protein [Oerskovia sp. JB1-3-2]
MGRHTAPRRTARRRTPQAVTTFRPHRSTFGVAASLTAMALTTAVATAGFASPGGATAPSADAPTDPTTSAPDASTTRTASGAGWQAPRTAAGGTFGLVVESTDPQDDGQDSAETDPLTEAVEEASAALARSEMLAAQSTGAVSADRLEKINAETAALRELVDTTRSTLEDALGQETGATPGDVLDPEIDLDTPELEVPEPLLAADSTDRTTERASRDSERSPLTLLEDDADATAGTDAEEVDAEPRPTDTQADDAADTDADAGTAEPDAAESDDAAEEAEEAEAAGSQAPTPEEIAATTKSLTALLDGASSDLAVQVEPAPPTAEEIAAERAAKAAAEAAKLEAELEERAADAAAMTAAVQGYSNGNIPTDLLHTPSFAPGHYVRADAGVALEALNAAYREQFGRDISINSSYRSYATQVAVKAEKGFFAATPGTSDHGWGLAIDLGDGVNSYGTAQYAWMRENAPRYGWDNPVWARAGGSKNEPWHWEFDTGS